MAIATYNEEENLARCLDSVTDSADEIVVVDGGSTDRTVALAKRYTDEVTVTDNPSLFHINKQKAIERARGEWILQLDADEKVGRELMDEIQSVIKSNPEENGFYIKRRNYFLGKWIKKGGWYPDPVIRLFRRGKGYLPCKSVHEQMRINGSVGMLTHDLLHYSYGSMEEYWRKAEAYIEQRVRDLYDQYKGLRPWTLWFSPAVKFLLLYVRHQLFLEGYRGLLLAWASALQEYKAVRKYVSYAHTH